MRLLVGGPSSMPAGFESRMQCFVAGGDGSQATPLFPRRSSRAPKPLPRLPSSFLRCKYYTVLQPRGSAGSVAVAGEVPQHISNNPPAHLRPCVGGHPDEGWSSGELARWTRPICGPAPTRCLTADAHQPLTLPLTTLLPGLPLAGRACSHYPPCCLHCCRLPATCLSVSGGGLAASGH